MHGNEAKQRLSLVAIVSRDLTVKAFLRLHLLMSLARARGLEVTG